MEVHEGRLGGKVAVITGAAWGIGRASAERFAVEGARVVVADLNADAAEKAAADIMENGGEATHVRCDVTRQDDARRMVETAVERYGKLDILFNNAGFTNPPRPIEETTEEDLDRAMAVNVKGVYLCSQAAIPAMRDGGGSIVVTASIRGCAPVRGSRPTRLRRRRPSTSHERSPWSWPGTVSGSTAWPRSPPTRRCWLRSSGIGIRRRGERRSSPPSRSGGSPGQPTWLRRHCTWRPTSQHTSREPSFPWMAVEAYERRRSEPSGAWSRE